MSAEVTDIIEGMPHVVIPTPDGNAHVMPRVVIERIRDGTLDVRWIDDWKMIVRGVFGDWLASLGEVNDGR